VCIGPTINPDFNSAHFNDSSLLVLSGSWQRIFAMKKKSQISTDLVLEPPILFRPDLTQILPKFVSFSCPFVFSQLKISSIFPRTRTARRRFNSGTTAARPLIYKLVKPIKIAQTEKTKRKDQDKGNAADSR